MSEIPCQAKLTDKVDPETDGKGIRLCRNLTPTVWFIVRTFKNQHRQREIIELNCHCTGTRLVMYDGDDTWVTGCHGGDGVMPTKGETSFKRLAWVRISDSHDKSIYWRMVIQDRVMISDSAKRERFVNGDGPFRHGDFEKISVGRTMFDTAETISVGKNVGLCDDVDWSQVESPFMWTLSYVQSSSFPTYAECLSGFSHPHEDSLAGSRLNLTRLELLCHGLRGPMAIFDWNGVLGPNHDEVYPWVHNLRSLLRAIKWSMIVWTSNGRPLKGEAQEFFSKSKEVVYFDRRSCVHMREAASIKTIKGEGCFFPMLYDHHSIVVDDNKEKWDSRMFVMYPGKCTLVAAKRSATGMVPRWVKDLLVVIERETPGVFKTAPAGRFRRGLLKG